MASRDSLSVQIYSAVDQSSNFNSSMLFSQGQQTGPFPRQKMNHVCFQSKYLTLIAFIFTWADRDRRFWWSHGPVYDSMKQQKKIQIQLLGPVNQSFRCSLLWKLKDELLLSYFPLSLITVLCTEHRLVNWFQESFGRSGDESAVFSLKNVQGGSRSQGLISYFGRKC